MGLIGLEQLDSGSGGPASTLLGPPLIPPPCSETSNNTGHGTHACTVHSLGRVRGSSPEFQEPTMISMMWSSSFRSDLQLEPELSGVGPWEERLSSRSYGPILGAACMPVSTVSRS